MSAPSIYIGFSLIAPINNQKRYEAVINEILQYLSTHTQEISIKVQPGRFLTLESKSETSNDQVCIPLSSLFLHTCYFKLNSGFQLQEEDKKFASISWEIFNIVKENFPSKIHLHQDNLELCKPVFLPLSHFEELRRQISCLMSIKDEERPLTIDELEDAWYTLQFAEKVQDVRSQNICLDLINQYAPVSSLKQLKNDTDTLRRIIDKNDLTQLSSNRIIAQELYEKITNYQGGNHMMSESLQQQVNDMHSEETMSVQSENSNFQFTNNIERPTSTRMCLFQLAESNDINRVTVILDTLSMRSKETLQQLRKKYHLNSKLLTVLKKYCNGDYGFDQVTSRKGSFQLNLIKLMIILSQDYAVFLEYIKTSAIDLLSQIIEEAIIFAYEDSLSGNVETNGYKFNADLFKFMRIGLDFIELTIGREFSEFVPTIRDNLRKIQQRMIKLMSKKENMLLNYFYEQQTNDNHVEENKNNQNYDQDQEQPSSLTIDQLTELKAICQDLYEFAMELNYKIQRIEALNDFNEQHEEKHLRLFYKVLSNKQMTKENKPVKQTNQSKVNFIEQPMKEQEYQDKKQINPQFTTYQTEIDKSDQKKILEQNQNIFMKNKIEQNYKRQNYSRQQKEYSDKENTEPHYIGSPFKPLQRNYYSGYDEYEQ